MLQDGSLTYVYGLGGLISQTDGSRNQSYFLGNGLDSTEKLTDGSGNVIASYKYDIFGAVRSGSGSGWTEYRFNAQQDDATLGYTYLRARYYDPATGRFLSKDPFPGVLTNPASQHYYGYAFNSPIIFTDPTGLAGGDKRNLWNEYRIPGGGGGGGGGGSPGGRGSIGGGGGRSASTSTTGEYCPDTPRLGFGNVSGGATTSDKALVGAQEWLGAGYREIAPGVFRSADNARQFRMRDADIAPRIGTPHVHFEAIGSDGREIIENSHLQIFDSDWGW